MPDLKDVLKGKVVILCIGNKDRGDDGAGVHIAERIAGKISYDVINAGVTPENHTGTIKSLKPDTLIIIDALHFDGEPGEERLFAGEDLRSGKISTHDVSPKLLIEYLKASINAAIYVLGIRPKSNKFGEGLSKEVEKTVNKVVNCLTI